MSWLCCLLCVVVVCGCVREVYFDLLFFVVDVYVLQLGDPQLNNQTKYVRLCVLSMCD